MAYLGPPPSQKLATPTSQYFSGNGSTTAFTLNRPVNVAEDLNVFVNNVAQQPGAGKSYTATGTTLTFDAAPDAGTNNVYVVYRGLSEGTLRLEQDPNSGITATTGTFTGAFTSPGIDDNADATAITIDSSERVGIGVTSMVNKLVLPNASYFAMQDSSGAESLAVRANSSNAMEILTGGGVRATIDSSGRTTIPNQPLFVATTPIEGTSGALTADNDVRYKRWTTVLFNIGSHFNNASGGGFFTAPVAGRYYVMFKAGHKVTYGAWNGMYLFKNSTNLLVFWDPPDSSANGNYTSNNASIVLTLAANDTCGVGYHTNYSDLSANSNNFISIGLLH
tara:strand:- start:2488 stop:3495 length:1008 start_codon:yes stop_codon:yes gene_type:complete